MKKILALLLSTLMLCTCLFSCEELLFDEDYTGDGIQGGLFDNLFEDDTNETEKNNTTNKATNNSTETKEYGKETFTAVVPVDTLDFDGEPLTIIHRDAYNLQREWYSVIAEDELSEMILIRNELVSEKLNIDVNYMPLASSDYSDCLDLFTAAIREDVDTGAHYYDIVANYAYAGASVAVRDYIADLNDKEVFPYFEFSLPCWNQAMVRNTMANGQLFYITGDINLSTFDKSIVMFLNKTMYNEKKSNTDPDDLQDIAIEGTWDYEDLYRWTTVFEDTNGISGAQHDDFYGISTGFGSIPTDALPYAWDLEYLTEEPDGTHSYNIVGNQKIENAIVKAQNLLNGAISAGVNNANDTGACSLGGYSEPITHFASDKCIFAIHLLYASKEDNEIIRSMDSEFGLLPMPKYNESQENYGTTAHDSYTLMTVIDHSESSIPTRGEEISAYLQYSTEETYTGIRGYYVNKIVMPKYFIPDDPNGSHSKSIEIFQMIADSIEFDFLSVYAPQLNGVLNSRWRNVVTGASTYTSAEAAYAADQTNFDTALDEVDSWLGLK